MSAPAPRIIVLAKAPVAGNVKTRLCPPCTHDQAAALAEAALRDTLAAVTAVDGARHAVALDGAPDGWLPPGVDVVAQSSGTLADRLAAAFESGDGPTLLVGMDTPQLTPDLLERGMSAILDGHDAVIGPSPDGGYWAIGLSRPDGRVFHGVPMSSAATLRHQRARLDELALRTAEMPALRDFDDIASAVAVADAFPHLLFSRTLAACGVAGSSP